MVLMKEKLKFELYYLQDGMIEGEAVVASGSSNMNNKESSLHTKQNMLNRNQTFDLYKHEVFGKQKRVNFVTGKEER